MLIVCPTCATSYDVDAASLRPDGRQVRCVRCRAVWRPGPTHAEKLMAAAEALAPVRRMVEAMTVEAMAEAAAAPGSPDLPPDPAGTTPGPAAPEPAEGEAATASEGVEAAHVEVESPSIAPADIESDLSAPETAVPEDAPATADATGTAQNIEAVAGRRPRLGLRSRPRWPLSHLQSAILALVILDAIVVGWRMDFVRALPQTASFYASIGLPVNLRGVRFDNLVTTGEQHEGVPILVVEGSVVNDAGRIVDVPRLRFAVRNAAHEEIYSWTAVPPRALLPAGESVSFRTRLASPPPDAHDVLVRFINRADALAGTR
jgi:predicted Zn finger-like uncharacterized protein